MVKFVPQKVSQQEHQHRDKRSRIAPTVTDRPKIECAEIANTSRSQISQQVEKGFKRRNNKPFIQSTFDSHQDKKTGSITAASSLESALIKLGINLHSTDIAERFKSMGLNDGAGLDFQDFSSFISTPSPVEEWVSALPLSQLVADAMPQYNGCISTDQLRNLSRATRHQLVESCEVIMEHLQKMLLDELAILKRAYDKLDRQAETESNHKFQTCMMSVGNIDDFHEGLAARIGKIELFGVCVPCDS